MCTDVVVVTPDTPTIEAVELMRKHDVSCLPVVGVEGELVGIMTERDLVRLATPLIRSFFARADAGANGDDSEA